jgi:hypothetical protein
MFDTGPPPPDNSGMSRFALRVCGHALSLCLAMCALSCGEVVAGSGRVTTESRAVGHFKEIELSGSGELIAEQADSESVSIEAEDNLLPLITANVSGDRLDLGFRNGVNIHPTKPMIYRVKVKELTGLEISGSGSGKLTKIDTPRLVVRISGSGEVHISGKAEKQEVHISGSGSYSAEHLASKDADVEISGSGSATVDVSEHLEAGISGSGSVEYTGNPRVNQHISGSGSINHKGS